MMTGILLAGTESIFGYSNIPLYAVVGMGFVGLGMSMVIIPIMPEILEAVEDKHTNFNEVKLQNNVSGYFVLCQGLGETVGPFTDSIMSMVFTDHRST